MAENEYGLCAGCFSGSYGDAPEIDRNDLSNLKKKLKASIIR